MADDLSPIVSEFPTQQAADAYDAWFRAKIEKSINSTEPRIPHDEVMSRIREKLLKYAPDLDI